MAPPRPPPALGLFLVAILINWGHWELLQALRPICRVTVGEKQAKRQGLDSQDEAEASHRGMRNHPSVQNHSKLLVVNFHFYFFFMISSDFYVIAEKKHFSVSQFTKLASHIQPALLCF